MTEERRSPVALEKARLRQRMRAELLRLSEAERRDRSRRAAERIEAVAEVRAAANLLLYRPLPTEVDTDAIFAAALSRGQPTFFPKVEGSDLRFHRVAADTRWWPGTLGTLEPEGGAELSARDLERGETVVIVPGLAFSELGERLGRGGGHYDRLLRSSLCAGRVRAIGFAFELQVLPSIPTTERDARVDLVVTENRVYSSASRT